MNTIQVDYMNLATRRACVEAPFGCSCYVVEPFTGDDNELTLHRVGVAASGADARRWCDGDDTVSLLQLHSPESVKGA